MCLYPYKSQKLNIPLSQKDQHKHLKQDFSDAISPSSSICDCNSHLRSLLDKQPANPNPNWPSVIPHEDADAQVQQYRGEFHDLKQERRKAKRR